MSNFEKHYKSAYAKDYYLIGRVDRDWIILLEYSTKMLWKVSSKLFGRLAGDGIHIGGYCIGNGDTLVEELTGFSSIFYNDTFIPYETLRHVKNVKKKLYNEDRDLLRDRLIRKSRVGLYLFLSDLDKFISQRYDEYEYDALVCSIMYNFVSLLNIPSYIVYGKFNDSDKFKNVLLRELSKYDKDSPVIGTLSKAVRNKDLKVLESIGFCFDAKSVEYMQKESISVAAINDELRKEHKKKIKKEGPSKIIGNIHNIVSGKVSSISNAIVSVIVNKTWTPVDGRYDVDVEIALSSFVNKENVKSLFDSHMDEIIKLAYDYASKSIDTGDIKYMSMHTIHVLPEQRLFIIVYNVNRDLNGYSDALM